MVATEEERAKRFQDGLQLDTQMYLTPMRLKTLSDVLDAARDLERLQVKKNRGKAPQQAQKRPFQLKPEEPLQQNVRIRHLTSNNSRDVDTVERLDMSSASAAWLKDYA